jgi:hypothetical protein
MNPAGLQSSTRTLNPTLTATLQSLRPGQHIKITQTVRVGQKSWTTTVTGTYRELNYLHTGLATDRVPEDDIIVVNVHFTKDNGELSCITLDENSQVEQI